MRGGSSSKCGSRHSAAHIRSRIGKSFADSGRVVFKMWLTAQRRAHSLNMFQEFRTLKARGFQDVAL
eukprot:3562929-Pyramimonas_sp.AAC.1